MPRLSFPQDRGGEPDPGLSVAGLVAAAIAVAGTVLRPGD